MEPREAPTPPTDKHDNERPDPQTDRPEEATEERVDERAEDEARENAGISARTAKPMDRSLEDELRGEHSDPSVMGNTPADR